MLIVDQRQQLLGSRRIAGFDLREDAGIFTVLSFVANGKKPEDVENSLRAEIKKIQNSPVSDAELEKAKNQLITGRLRQRETNDGKAGAIGYAATVLHDAAEVNSGLAKLQAVTAADVNRVVKKYIKDGKSLTITYVSKGGAQ